MTTLYKTNPLEDPRWEAFVQRHPRASVFHTAAWLEALRRTYAYEPTVLTTSSPNGDLTNGIVFCQVRSWLTGNRLVSLPFSDHCEPLLDDIGQYREFSEWLRMECRLRGYKFVELRPLSTIQDPSGLQPSQSYCFHELDIRASLEQIFQGLHKDSIQRRIRRAERERISYESGRSNQLVDDFFQLLLITRRRHQLPPQPRSWFRNMVECMGTNIDIRLARKNGSPIAAVLSLCNGTSVIYKYGCSDEHFHNLGAMPFLFWRLIEESKASGAERIDFGRSDLDNEGLLAFKDKFGAKRQLLTYYRYPSMGKAKMVTKPGSQAIRHLFSVLPDIVVSTAGRVLYRHIG
jgi:CelD/BcsL family acetyltransferase involved in cellulose biosynthesis